MAKIQFHISNAFNPKSVISVLLPLKIPFDSSRIAESAAKRSSQLFVYGYYAAAFKSSLCLKPTSPSNKPRAKKGMLRNYPNGVSYLPQIYDANYVIDCGDAALTRYIQLSTLSQTQCAEGLVKKSPRCGKVYDKYILKVVLMEGLPESARIQPPFVGSVLKRHNGQAKCPLLSNHNWQRLSTQRKD